MSRPRVISLTASADYEFFKLAVDGEPDIHLSRAEAFIIRDTLCGQLNPKNEFFGLFGPQDLHPGDHPCPNQNTPTSP